MNHFKGLENKIKKMLLEELQNFAATFKNIGITYDQPKIEVWNSLSDSYESEFQVSLYQNGKFIDIIECHIFRGGKQIAELEEIKCWFDDAISDFIKSVND